jgi:hypothetical protein
LRTITGEHANIAANSLFALKTMQSISNVNLWRRCKWSAVEWHTIDVILSAKWNTVNVILRTQGHTIDVIISTKRNPVNVIFSIRSSNYGLLLQSWTRHHNVHPA